MKDIELPYGRGTITADIPDDRFNGCLISRMSEYMPEKSQPDTWYYVTAGKSILEFRPKR